MEDWKKSKGSNFEDLIKKVYELILLISFRHKWKFDRFVDIETSAPRWNDRTKLMM